MDLALSYGFSTLTPIHNELIESENALNTRLS